MTHPSPSEQRDLDPVFVRRVKVFIAVAAGVLLLGGPILVFVP